MIDNTLFDTRTAMFVTLGCKLNFAETSTVANLLADKGIRRAQAGETPDLCVVNTCSVTDLADKKCRQAIRQLHRRFPSARIIVTGCYAQLKPGEVADIEGVDMVVGINDKLRIAQYVDQLRTTDPRAPEIVPSHMLREFMPSCSRGDRTRYFLKVQDGCDYWCSYCTIPAARGRSRSGSIDSLVAQAAKVASEGGREIVITGVNIGDFGKGRSDSFIDLIRQLDNVDGIERYRISSIEPNLLTEEIIEFVAASRRFMPHFHIPLQSGNDEVLKLMRRHYDTDHFRHKIEAVRSTMPHAFIGVDLIVGARGETIERFEASREFIESLPLSRLHVFTYSERPGTRALDIDHIVDQAEKHRRTQIMLGVSERMLREFSTPATGMVRPVLLEHPHRGHMGGFTDNYLRVELADMRPELANKVVNMRLDTLSADGTTFSGTIIENNKLTQ
ncbi:MAG: tRNA (N(6)-L-threonylcarbamoyladenosine(37)-C(2))-methylthiotransferase MtaB [Muribaculaceae bacterium]|nr:tRNA (N(6)-L-threonylcarbamoyladenosine(37)-C(2))-methylthiotransferase MtaB [Muribaculaceae bacterium]